MWILAVNILPMLEKNAKNKCFTSSNFNENYKVLILYRNALKNDQL